MQWFGALHVVARTLPAPALFGFRYHERRAQVLNRKCNEHKQRRAESRVCFSGSIVRMSRSRIAGTRTRVEARPGGNCTQASARGRRTAGSELQKRRSGGTAIAGAVRKVHG